MSSVVLAGSTGLVGGNILSTLTAHPSITKIHAYTRKDLPLSEKISPLQAADWPSIYPSPNSTTAKTEKPPSILFSALGTSRAAAGGLANQRKVDHDLNLSLATAAKAAQTPIYVLVSSSGANSASNFPYLKMKGELEDAVKALGFPHLVILRPGLIVGERNETRIPELMMRRVAGFLGATIGDRGKDFWAQDAVVIARAGVAAGLACLEGKEGWTEGTKVLGQADIVKYGRTEWKS